MWPVKSHELTSHAGGACERTQVWVKIKKAMYTPAYESTIIIIKRTTETETSQFAGLWIANLNILV